MLINIFTEINKPGQRKFWLLIILIISNVLSNFSQVLIEPDLENYRDYYEDVQSNVNRLRSQGNQDSVLRLLMDFQVDTSNKYNILTPLLDLNDPLLYGAGARSNPLYWKSHPDLDMAAFDMGIGLRIWNIEGLYSLTGLVWGRPENLAQIPGAFLYPILHPYQATSFDTSDPPPKLGVSIDEVFSLTQSYSYIGYKDETLRFGVGWYAIMPEIPSFKPYTPGVLMNVMEFTFALNGFKTIVLYNKLRNEIENSSFSYDTDKQNIDEENQEDFTISPTIFYKNKEEGLIIGLSKLAWKFDTITLSAPFSIPLKELSLLNLSPGFLWKPIDELNFYAKIKVNPFVQNPLGGIIGAVLTLPIDKNKTAIVTEASLAWNDNTNYSGTGNIIPLILRLKMSLAIP